MIRKKITISCGLLDDKGTKLAVDLLDDGINKVLVFKAKKLDPDQWAELFHKSGARYVVLTVKNADGFTLFPSGRSKWNSVDVGPKKDIVDIVSHAVRKYGIKFGVRYSLLEGCNKLFLDDIARGNTTVYTDTIVWPDIKLLIEKYRPSLLWAEGKKDVKCQRSSECKYWKSPKLLSWLYKSSPVRDKIVVNDRWCQKTRGRHGDYYQFKSRVRLLHTHKWELIFKMLNQTLYYRKLVDPEKVLTIDELLSTIVRTVSYGGNALINVQVTRDGLILPIVQERLLQLGKFLNNNGQAIYYTTPCSHLMDSFNTNVFYTCTKSIAARGLTVFVVFKTVYVIFLKWPSDNLLTIKDVTAYVWKKEFLIQMINPVKDIHCAECQEEYIEVPFELTDDLMLVDLSSPSIIINDMHAWVLKITFEED